MTVLMTLKYLKYGTVWELYVTDFLCDLISAINSRNVLEVILLGSYRHESK